MSCLLRRAKRGPRARWKSLRRKGVVPGVLYGAKRTATLLEIDGKEFETKVASIEGTHLIRLNSNAGDPAAASFW